jgi:hypothetical protein
MEEQRRILESRGEDVDAIFDMAEEGAAWTVLYPSFSLVVPKPIEFLPVGYAVAHGNARLLTSFNAWLLVEKAKVLLDDETVLEVAAVTRDEDRVILRQTPASEPMTLDASREWVIEPEPWELDENHKLSGRINFALKSERGKGDTEESKVIWKQGTGTSPAPLLHPTPRKDSLKIHGARAG